jgi:hypothetical protein
LTYPSCRRRMKVTGPEGSEALLTIHRLDTSDAVTLFCETPPEPGMTPSEVRSFCEDAGLLAFAVEDDGRLAGLALARSGPKALLVLAVEGHEEAVRLLLERLVRLAGERDVCAWCAGSRDDLREMLEARGFEPWGRGSFGGRQFYLYRWRQNEDLAEGDF